MNIIAPENIKSDPDIPYPDYFDVINIRLRDSIWLDRMKITQENKWEIYISLEFKQSYDR